MIPHAVRPLHCASEIDRIYGSACRPPSLRRRPSRKCKSVKSLKNAAFLLRIVGKMVEEAGDDASVFGNVLGDIL